MPLVGLTDEAYGACDGPGQTRRRAGPLYAAEVVPWALFRIVGVEKLVGLHIQVVLPPTRSGVRFWPKCLLRLE